MICVACHKTAKESDTFFCYWCGQPVCADCGRSVSLPLNTEAVVCPPCQHKTEANEAADETMWAAMVEAALAGHDLTSWQLTEDGNGWQAHCRRCEKTVWVGASGVMYSLLSDRCA